MVVNEFLHHKNERAGYNKLEEYKLACNRKLNPSCESYRLSDS